MRIRGRESHEKCHYQYDCKDFQDGCGGETANGSRRGTVTVAQRPGFTLGKNGGVREIIENVKKAINTAVDVSDTPLKSDAEMLLSEFTDLLSVTQLLDDAESEIDFETLNDLLSNTDENPEQK